MEGFISFIHGVHKGLIKRDHGYWSCRVPGFSGNDIIHRGLVVVLFLTTESPALKGGDGGESL